MTESSSIGLYHQFLLQVIDGVDYQLAVINNITNNLGPSVSILKSGGIPITW